MKYLLTGEESSRLKFRPVDISDYKDWLTFHQHPESSKYWIADRRSPEVECQAWFEKQAYRYQNDLGGMNALIDKKTSQLIGYCGLLIQTVDDQTEMEIGYSLIPKFWNQGYATEAARKCRDFAFSHNFAQNLISIISVSNTPSANVARKNGMHIRNQTTYHKNPVNIHNISIVEWQKIKD